MFFSDLDVEHRDIMAKALRSYSRHRYGERLVGEGSEDFQTDTGDSPTHPKPTPPVINGDSVKKLANQIHATENANLTRNFKLSLCRLRFHDDDDADDSPPLVNQGKGPSLAFKRKPLLSPTRPLVTPVPTLYQLEESDGIIADSVGHIYKPKRIRPWTALPGKFLDLVKINTPVNENRRYGGVCHTRHVTEQLPVVLMWWFLVGRGGSVPVPRVHLGLESLAISFSLTN